MEIDLLKNLLPLGDAENIVFTIEYRTQNDKKHRKISDMAVLWTTNLHSSVSSGVEYSSTNARS